MECRVLIYIEINGISYRVGRLWSRYQRGREHATFLYDPDWLEYPHTAFRWGLPCRWIRDGITPPRAKRSSVLSVTPRLIAGAAF